ncbi:MAG TPA: PIN domain-containing protein [Gaiellaceae bacterium]|nr:PIN domain-containing protein [Gaiellaceae bacterium]
MIFVDTSFWVALRLRRDDRHEDALALLDSHADLPLVTSSHVRGETWTFLRTRGGQRDGVAFLEMVEDTPRLDVAFVGEQLEREALDWLRRHDERPYSFVDATSFALMRALGIHEAFAFDGDFAAAGFAELRPA